MIPLKVYFGLICIKKKTGRKKIYDIRLSGWVLMEFMCTAKWEDETGKKNIRKYDENLWK